MKKMIYLFLVILIVSCATTKKSETIEDPTKISSKAIIVTEMGLADKSLPENQQKYLSKQAAILQAERAILRAIEIHLESNVVTDKGMIKSDTVQEKIKGMLKGVEIIEIKYDDSSTCYVTLKISKKSLDNLNKLISKMK
jgi:hypothetical protein